MFVIKSDYGAFVKNINDDTKLLDEAKRFRTIKQAKKFMDAWVPTKMYQVKKVSV